MEKYSFSPTIYFFISLLLISNLLFKFLFISDGGLWSDEAASIAYSIPPLNECLNISKETAVPPGYYIVLHFWLNIFSDSEFSIRSLSVIFSVLTALLLYFFAKRFLNKETALIASLFFLLSNTNLYYAQEARPYTMVLFLSLCSFFIFFEFLKKPTIWKTILMGIISFLLIFTHYLSVFVLVVQGLVALIYYKRDKNIFRFYFFSLALAFLMFSPWLKYVVRNFTLVADIWLPTPTFSQFKWVFIEFAGDKILAFMFIALAVFSAGWLLFEYFKERKIIGTTGSSIKNDSIFPPARFPVFSFSRFHPVPFSRFLSFLSTRINIPYLVILGLWAFLPVILGYIISQYNAVFYPRYYLYSSVGLYLFLSYLFSAVDLSAFSRFLPVPFSRLPAEAQRRHGFLPVPFSCYHSQLFFKILLCAPIVLYSVYILDLSPSKGEDWKKIVPEIIKEKEAAPSPIGEGRGGVAVIVSAWYQYRPFAYYYNREYFRDYENTIELLRKDNIHCIDNAAGLDSIALEPFRKIILVQSHQPVADPENTLYKQLNADYKMRGTKEYEGIKVTVFGMK